MKTREVKLAMQAGKTLMFLARGGAKPVPVKVLSSSGAPGTWIVRASSGETLTVDGIRLFPGG